MLDSPQVPVCARDARGRDAGWPWAMGVLWGTRGGGGDEFHPRRSSAPPYSGPTNRYPTHGTVTICFGLAGLASIFLRTWLMKTRRYSGSSP